MYKACFIQQILLGILSSTWVGNIHKLEKVCVYVCLCVCVCVGLHLHLFWGDSPYHSNEANTKAICRVAKNSQRQMAEEGCGVRDL